MIDLADISDPALEAAVWDLEPLVDGQGDDGARRLMVRALDRAHAFAAAYTGRVANFVPAELIAAAGELDEIRDLLLRAGGYANLRGIADGLDPSLSTLQAAFDAASAEVTTALLFFELEWLALDDVQVDDLLISAGGRLDFAGHHLRVLRTRRRYLLSPGEERILAETSVQRLSAWKRVYADSCASLTVELDGEELPLAQAYSLLSSPDRETRQKADAAMAQGCESGLPVRVAAYNQVLGEKAVDDRLRGYPTWLSERNLKNEMTDGSVDLMLKTIAARRDLVRRWNRLKARLLGVERLSTIDGMAPLTSVDRRVSYARSQTIVTSAWSAFSPRAGAIVDGFFTERRIDAPIRAGKPGGACCEGNGPSRPPYVQLNYDSRPQGTTDLAHELGHGLHFELARANSALQYETSIPMMEVASTFSEALVAEELMREASNDRERLEMLAARLDDATGCVFVTIASLGGEAAMHAARRERGELTADEITELWCSAHREVWEDTVDISPGYGLLWSFIPHMMEQPGYLYSYSYGLLTAWSAYARYQQVGQPFSEDYLAMLAAGGSHSPQDLVAMIGLDLNDAGFWNSGLDLLEEMLNDAESLAGALQM